MKEAYILSLQICGCANTAERWESAAMIEADREEAAMNERAKIVAWLADIGLQIAADDIKAGEHLK
jgi:hypothetical protein